MSKASFVQWRPAFDSRTMHDEHIFRLLFETIYVIQTNQSVFQHKGIVGSVVECSPAMRAARVRFPDDA